MKRGWTYLLPALVGFLCLLPYLTAQHSAAMLQDHSMHEGNHRHETFISNERMDREKQLKLIADKKESEFNHHLAGFLVALGSAFILLQTVIGKRWLLAKYVWPGSFLVSGIFVLVWSDTELWPFGARLWIEALQHNSEVLQHKIFAALLLGLGCIEWLRVNRALTKAWAGLVFPVLAIAGSILLLFHQHQGGTEGPNHMESMARIQYEHLSYAIVGIGIGLAKGAAEVKMRGHKVFSNLWPLLMTVLGILLMFYRE